MPIFEYECPHHGVFELFIQEVNEYNIEIGPCDGCKDGDFTLMWPRVWSLVSMQPDNMWSGVSNEQGYFTSKKQYLSNLRDKNLVRVERGLTEDVKKKAKNRLPEQMAKNEKNLEKFLAKELASM